MAELDVVVSSGAGLTDWGVIQSKFHEIQARYRRGGAAWEEMAEGYGLSYVGFLGADSTRVSRAMSRVFADDSRLVAGFDVLRRFESDERAIRRAPIDFVLLPGYLDDYRPMLVLSLFQAMAWRDPLPTVICSGRCAHDDPDSDSIPEHRWEAVRYASVLKEGGYPEDKVIVRTVAGTSSGNVREWIDTLVNKCHDEGPRRILIVSHPQHVPRIALSTEIALSLSFPECETLMRGFPFGVSTGDWVASQDAEDSLGLWASELNKLKYDLSCLQDGSLLKFALDRKLIPDGLVLPHLAIYGTVAS
ncbi:MAG: ElyC/SanA/YdcF family protein [Thermomicrobiales bacterium]